MSETDETQNLPEPSPNEEPTTEPTSEAEPETYDDSAINDTSFEIIDPESLSLPEGAELAQEDAEWLAKWGENFGVPHQAAQEIMDAYFSRLFELRDGVAEQVDAEWQAQNEEWVGQLREMYGGDEAIQAAADQLAPVIDQFGGDDLREALAVTGAGNHPAMFRFLHNLANALSEGTPVSSNGGAASAPSQLERMYPTMSQKG